MRRYAPLVMAASALIAVSAASADPPSDETAALRAEVLKLRDRVATLEGQLARLLETLDESDRVNAELAAEPVASGERTGFGGRIKIDAIANSRSTGAPGGTDSAETTFTPGSIPIDGEGETGQLSANARESRFWFDSVLPTAMGDLDAYLEIDFSSFDGSGNERISNSHNLRLRHAYATLGNWTAGQTTSTFFNALSFPDLNDGNGPVGVLNIRQPLIRYRQETAFGHWTVAAEQPETVVRTVDGIRIAADDDRLPDLVGRFDVNNSRGSWSIAALVRQLRVDGVVAGAQDEELGYGVSLSGRLYIGTRDNLRFAITAGDGLGRYVSYNAFDAGALTASGAIKTTPIVSAFGAYQHWWNERLRSNWVIGAATADLDPDRLPGNLTERLFSSHLNLLWSPVSQATVGIEWLHGRRELANGKSGSINRFQLTSLYRFSW